MPVARVPRPAAAPSRPGNLVESGVHEFGADDVPVGPAALDCTRLVTLDRRGAHAVVAAALECGFNMLDTTGGHSDPPPGATLEMLGGLLAAQPDLRDDIVLVVGGGRRAGVPFDASAEHLRASCETALRTLDVDYLDVFLVQGFDWFADPAAVADELDRLVTDGLVVDVGVADHSPRQVEALASWIEAPIALHRFECSALHLAPHFDGTLDLATRDLMTTMACRPLAGGRLARGDGVSPDLLAVLDRLAAREGVDRAGVALAFVTCLRSQPIPVVSTTRPEHVAAARAALDIHLDRADCYAIVEASLGALR